VSPSAPVPLAQRFPPTPEMTGMSSADPTPPPYYLTLSSRTLPRLLVVVVVALLAIHLALQYDRFHAGRSPWEIQQLFDLDEEQSVPNWYSSAALGFAALLAAVVGARARRDRKPDAGRWRATAVILLYMSFDEVAGIHETVNSLSPISWTIPFGLLALVIAAWMLPWVLRLPAATRLGLIASGFIYIAGAVGIELVTSQFFDESNKRQLTYAFYTVVEEGMEMLGVVLMIHTLLRHMEREDGAAGVGLKAAGAGR
jgi:hypothetical protein